MSHLADTNSLIEKKLIQFPEFMILTIEAISANVFLVLLQEQDRILQLQEALDKLLVFF